MNTTTIDIYNVLVEAGVDKQKAKTVSDELLTRTEARERLATKEDLKDLKASIIQWMATMLVAQGATIVALQNLIG